MPQRPTRLPEATQFSDWHPILSGYQGSCILMAADDLGLFDKIGPAGRAAPAVARKLGCPARGATILLDACVALGLIRKSGTRYTNTPAAKRYLMKDSPQYKGAILRHLRHTFESWRQLPETIRTGQPPRLRTKKNPILDDPAINRDFILAMHAVGYDLAKLLAQEVDFSGVKHLLDLGGGPGSYSIALCEAHRGLMATIVDLPLTLKVARRHLKTFAVGKRIGTLEANFLIAPAGALGGGYDAALLSNILHAASPVQCRRLLKAVYKALLPGGRVVINEFLINENRCSPLAGALFSMNMLAATREGNCYTQKELKAWLRAAGFTAPKSVPLDGVHVATVARRPR